MTRLQQARAQKAKCRETQDRLEAALDDVIPTLSLPPSAAFEAVIAYGIDGLVAQGTVRSKEQALMLVSRALTTRGLIGQERCPGCQRTSGALAGPSRPTL
jgi:hypothetical protein